MTLREVVDWLGELRRRRLRRHEGHEGQATKGTKNTKEKNFVIFVFFVAKNSCSLWPRLDAPGVHGARQLLDGGDVFGEQPGGIAGARRRLLLERQQLGDDAVGNPGGPRALACRLEAIFRRRSAQPRDVAEECGEARSGIARQATRSRRARRRVSMKPSRR